MDLNHHPRGLLIVALREFRSGPLHPGENLEALELEILGLIHRRIRSAELECSHCSDVIQDTAVDFLRFLERHGAGAVESLAPWARTVAGNSAKRYLRKIFGTRTRRRPTVVSIDALLEGSSIFERPSAVLVTTNQEIDLERLLNESLQQLNDRHREFVKRLLLVQETRAGIITAMGLRSGRSYEYLQRQALAHLRVILQESLARCTPTTWVA